MTEDVYKRQIIYRIAHTGDGLAVACLSRDDTAEQILLIDVYKRQEGYQGSCTGTEEVVRGSVQVSQNA